MASDSILSSHPSALRSPANLPSGPSIPNALTFDVEEYFHVSAFEGVIKRHEWDSLPSRLPEPTEKILDSLAARNLRATFFVLGWVARRQPKLIRRIHAAGHSIGSHSYDHRLVYRLSPQTFRNDLRESLAVLQDIIGQKVISYRAPSFSITPRSLWALEILAEEGIQYDASIFPVYHDRYGLPRAPRIPFRVETHSGYLWEFPGTTIRFLGLPLPLGGGGYFRLYPLWLTVIFMRRLHRAGRPVLFYFHPWELDPEQPRIRAVSWPTTFRHYVNLDRTERKLTRLLDTFSWHPLEETIRNWEGRSPDIPTITPAKLA